MHAGKLTGDAAAARVYRILRARPGRWVDGWELTLGAQTSAVSTRISEVRSQLPKGEKIEVEQVGHGFWYRLVDNRPLTLFCDPCYSESRPEQACSLSGEPLEKVGTERAGVRIGAR